MAVRLLLRLSPALHERIERLVRGPERIVDPADPAMDPAQAVSSASADIVVAEAADDVAAQAILIAARAVPERPEVVLLSEGEDPEGDAAWLARGAMAVLPSHLADAELGAALRAFVERRRLLDRTRFEAAQAQGQDGQFVSASGPMRQLLETISRLSDARSPVLLLGETGVGKERIANLIHSRSPRSERPFIALNCAAIPSELVESELFGHEKGAFTGAHRARRGYFELATGGTLFLDEIGELPPGMQAKLLRVLQEGRIRPIGSHREIEVDVRVVAATNRDLKNEMEIGRFRSDLYYRLAVVELRVPALRERPQDIEALLDHNLHRFAAAFGRDAERYTPEARAALLTYNWPGNVRELINVVERAVLLCEGPEIGLEDLPGGIAAPLGSPLPASTAFDGDLSSTPTLLLPDEWLLLPWKSVRESLLREGELRYLSHLLRTSRGRIGVAARRAGMAERSLFEKMKRLGLRKEDYREE